MERIIRTRKKKVYRGQSPPLDVVLCHSRLLSHRGVMALAIDAIILSVKKAMGEKCRSKAGNTF